MSKERIIFLSAKTPFHTKDWSGIPYYLFNALSKVYDVKYIALPSFKYLRLLGYYLGRTLTTVTGKKYLFDYGIVLSLLYGFYGTIRLRKEKNVKFIFSPAGLSETAFLSTSLPVVSYGDCSTLQLIGYYPALLDVSSISVKEIMLVEKAAFKNTTLSIFSSAWASNFVYQKFKKTSIVIPFGSNLIPTESTIPSKNLTVDSYKLLFIGVDWSRKGGDIALKIHRQLLSEGLNVHLTFVGVAPPEGSDISEKVSVVENIDKDSDLGRKQMRSLFEEAHFFLLPTRADCTPIVIAEAYGFGVPVLANNTGGVSSMIMDGLTGYLITKNNVDEYCLKIKKLISNNHEYQQVISNCLQYYSTTYNWDSFAVKLKNEVTQLLAKR